MIIEGVTRDDIDFHLVGTNKGAIDIDITAVRYNSAVISGGDQRVKKSKRIVPQGERLSIPGIPVNGLKKNKTISVAIQHDSEIDGKIKTFTSLYKFILPLFDPVTAGQIINPAEWHQAEGGIAENTKPAIAGIIEKFSQPNGSALLGLYERHSNGEFSRTELNGSGRHFVYDAALNSVVFSVQYPNGQSKKIETSIKERKTLHDFALLWDDPKNSISLYVDGVLIEKK